MSKEKVTLKGYVRLKVLRPDGTVKYQHEGPNIVTTVGLIEAAELIAGVATVAPTHIAIGDGATDPSVGETELAGVEKDRQTATGSAAGVQATYISTTLGAGLAALSTIREAGLFNAGAAGDMFAHFLTGEFDLDTDERVEIVWTLTLS